MGYILILLSHFFVYIPGHLGREEKQGRVAAILQWKRVITSNWNYCSGSERRGDREEKKRAQHEKMHENTRVDATEVVGDEDFRIWQVRSLVPALTFGVGFYQSYCVLTAWWFSSSHEDKKAGSIVFGVPDALTAHLLQAYGRDIV